MKYLFAASALLSLSTLLSHAATPSAFDGNVQPRGSYTNSQTQFEKNKKGNVAFIGGSITEMNGYRPMVCEWLQKRYPDTTFTYTAAGISSTCSTTGAFRVESDVLSHGPVDLFFIEFAVNDDQDAHHTREECIRGLEGIIRHARNANPNTDIVVTFFVNEGMLAKLQKGETPLTIEAHEAVAKHYNVSTINLAKQAANEITAGKLTWKEYGGVHPAPRGNGIGASMIAELLSNAWTTPPAGALKAHEIPQPLDAMNYQNGRFIDPSKAVIKNGWTLDVPDWKALKGGKRERFTTIPMLSATEPGAEATLDFIGTAIGAFIVAGPDAGIAEASIDGGPAKSVELFSSYSTGLHYPRTVMLGTDLAPGKHTLTLKIAAQSPAQSPAQSTGHAMRIMQFTAN